MDIDDVLRRAACYMPEDRLPLIREAYDFAREKHEGQTRQTGEAYITHPVAVAHLVADLELDWYAIAAAFLHDVQEDCGVSNAEIGQRFGDDVARMVDGLTKLEHLPTAVTTALDQPRATLQAHNLRKMFLAMAEDVSVVLIKLCDRLHNMRTLWAVSEDKQRRISRETLDIYAPLASRLGVWQLKWELEDLAFRYLEPERYRQIARLLDARREERQRNVERASDTIGKHLAERGIQAEITGRAKHIYSIDQKLRRYAREGKSFEQIYDLLAIRILVDSIADCYLVLGEVHHLWRPIPGEFDDYIANPKESMYQSLHTTVVGPGGRPLEIQIRTNEMHRISEYGIAAHWNYKEGGSQLGRDEQRISWLRQLIEWQRELTEAEEFVETVKTDIFRDQVFVYTPKGDVLDLPAGATPLDFAYRIHTDLGHLTVGAKVNGRMVPLNYELKSGDLVDIMKGRAGKGPSRDWLNADSGYIRTSHAKTKIRQWFRRQERADNIERGRDLLQREIKRLALDISGHEQELADHFHYRAWDDLLAAVGYGAVSTQAVIIRLQRFLGEGREDDLLAADSDESAPPPGPTDGQSLHVLGMGNMLTTVGQCCNPIPGDPVVGYITRARGVTVHRGDCHNVLHHPEPERLVEVEWSGKRARSYPVPVRIDAVDRVGLLRDISNIVSEENVNMYSVRTTDVNDGFVAVLATLEVRSIEQLLRLFSRLEMVRSVRSVVRTVDGPRPAKAAAGSRA